MVELTLARGFPPADEATWKALVEDALKGAPFAALKSKTYDGIAIEPLYARAEGVQRIAGHSAGTPWSVMQRIDLPDAKTANTQALDDLNNGANALNLVFEGAVGDYGYTLPATEEAIGENEKPQVCWTHARLDSYWVNADSSTPRFALRSE